MKRVRRADGRWSALIPQLPGELNWRAWGALNTGGVHLEDAGTVQKDGEGVGPVEVAAKKSNRFGFSASSLFCTFVGF